jgi:hypothetical protein
VKVTVLETKERREVLTKAEVREAEVKALSVKLEVKIVPDMAIVVALRVKLEVTLVPDMVIVVALSMKLVV